MKHIFGWIVTLGLVIGVAVWVSAQQPGRMHGGGAMGGGMMGRNGMMGGGGMMGKNPSTSQAGEGAASTYAKLCANCHGATGKGDGPAAMALNPRPKDFTDCKVMAHESDEMLFKIIKDGGQAAGRSPLMPPWRGTLSDQRIGDLVEYIRSLCKQ